MEVPQDITVGHWRSSCIEIATTIAARLDRHDDRGATRGALLLLRLLVAGHMAEWVDIKYHKMTEQEAADAGQVLAEHTNSWLA